MFDPLASEALMKDVRALAEDIGPRPAGHPAERMAAAYVQRRLEETGFRAADVISMPVKAADTWFYLPFSAMVGTLVGNLFAETGRAGMVAGAGAALGSAFQLWRGLQGGQQYLSFLYPRRATQNLVARVLAGEERRQRVVLVGHLDSNKNRPTFDARVKRYMPASMTLGTLVPAVNGLALLWQAIRPGKLPRAAQLASLGVGVSFLPLLLLDERGGYVPGANDNATAVACLLGLAAYLKQNPLAHTEVWFVFTAAEEPGCVGMNRFLDVYGRQLKQAWFIDFEMVGAQRVAFVAQHGLSYLSRYQPDAESLAAARAISQRHPELQVEEARPVIAEEVGSLRSRGLRGICLAGLGADGWLANWHQASDDAAHIEPAGLERAARFALALMSYIDGVNSGSELK